jgi:hypothetical protein
LLASIPIAAIVLLIAAIIAMLNRA